VNTAENSLPTFVVEPRLQQLGLPPHKRLANARLILF